MCIHSWALQVFWGIPSWVLAQQSLVFLRRKGLTSAMPTTRARVPWTWCQTAPCCSSSRASLRSTGRATKAIHETFWIIWHDITDKVLQLCVVSQVATSAGHHMWTGPEQCQPAPGSHHTQHYDQPGSSHTAGAQWMPHLLWAGSAGSVLPLSAQCSLWRCVETGVSEGLCVSWVFSHFKFKINIRVC